MPLWLQLTLLAAFWVAFWSFLASWARREARAQGAPRPTVQDLYPPRIHQSRLPSPK